METVRLGWTESARSACTLTRVPHRSVGRPGGVPPGVHAEPRDRAAAGPARARERRDRVVVTTRTRADAHACRGAHGSVERLREAQRRGWEHRWWKEEKVGPALAVGAVQDRRERLLRTRWRRDSVCAAGEQERRRAQHDDAQGMRASWPQVPRTGSQRQTPESARYVPQKGTSHPALGCCGTATPVRQFATAIFTGPAYGPDARSRSIRRSAGIRQVRTRAHHESGRMRTSATRECTAATLSGEYKNTAGASAFSISIAARHAARAAARLPPAVLARSTCRSNSGFE